MQDINSAAGLELTRGGMILIALVAGGDYNTVRINFPRLAGASADLNLQTGVPGCGGATALALAHYGLGDTLLQATENMATPQLAAFCVKWRVELIDILRGDPRGLIGNQQRKSIADAVPHGFPSLDVLYSYTQPVVSSNLSSLSFSFTTRRPRLAISPLATFLDHHLGLRTPDTVLPKFDRAVWPALVLRSLLVAAIEPTTQDVSIKYELMHRHKQAKARGGLQECTV